DYSIGADINDEDAVRDRMKRALEAEFRRHGFMPFDVSMGVQPDRRGKPDTRPTWGGWVVKFKLISLEKWKALERKPEKRRHAALELDGNKKAFQIDISKFEFVGGAQVVDFDGYLLRVYSPSMIVFEKLRALCQQLPEYEFRANPTP